MKTIQKSNLVRAMHFIWDSGPGWTIGTSVFILIQGALPILAFYLNKIIIDTVVHRASAPYSQVFHHVVLLIGAAAGIALFGALSRTIGGVFIEAHGQAITDHISSLLHVKSSEVDLDYYENSHYYDMLHRAQREASFRPTHILNGLLKVGESAVSLIGVIGLLFAFHWMIALGLLITSIPGIFARIRYSGEMFQWQKERTQADRQTWYFNWLLTSKESAKEIRLFHLSPLFIERFRDVRRLLRREKLHIAIRHSRVEFISDASAAIALFAAYLFVAARAVMGTITLGSLVMYYQAFQRGQSAFQDLLANISNLYEDDLFLSSLFEFLDLKPQIQDSVLPVAVPPLCETGIVFDHVSFRYSPEGRPVLEDISLVIRPGETIALVGKNGSGKTTLVKLLCRLYDPIGGRIEWEGIDVRDFTQESLRGSLSVVFQDYMKYNLSAKENIGFGNACSPLDTARIEAAARSAGAHEVINRLPQGYDTPLGKWIEQGEELSVGEWQKIALARAFLRDAEMIVLDEPTSAMDAKAESEIFQTFRELARGRTAILISHRLSTVKMADRIYVLDEGRIIESGTHEQLVEREGHYSELFDAQARSYR